MALGFPDIVPTLDDGVVTLRAMREGDLPAVVEQSRDPQTVRWTTVPTPYGPSEAAAFFETVRTGWHDGSRSTWVVEHDGDFAGLVSLRPHGSGRVEIGLAAHPKQRGQGLMSRAVGLVCRHAFSDGAEVVLWHAQVGNFGSRKVAWRNGFRISGSLRASRERRGVLVDTWAGSLVKDEPMEPRHRRLEPVILDGDGLRLRAFRAADAAALPEALDQAAARFMTGAMPTRGDFDGWLLAQGVAAAEGQSVTWAIADGATDQVLGEMQFFRMGNRVTAASGSLSYWLLEAARGRGTLGKALDTAIGHAFAPLDDGGLGLHRLEGGCAVDNSASARVMRRAGFHLVGREREALTLAPDEHTGLLRFDLLSSDDRSDQRVDPVAVPVLETERLRLRPWRDTDVPGDDEGPDDASLRFMPADSHPDATAFPEWLARQRARAEEGGMLTWCVADRESDHAIGNVLLFRMDPVAGRFQAEVGYWLHPGARGRGVVAEALDAVIGHAFAPVDSGGLGLTRLHAGTDLDNRASQAVLERVGFRQWGTDRRAYRRSSGELTDGVYFELLATDDRTDRRARRRTPLTEVTLEGELVRLRRWRDEDRSRVVEACRDERTGHWLATLPSPYTDDHAATYVSQCHSHAGAGTGLFLAMADPSDDRCIGSVAVMDLASGDQTTGEIGYWTHPDARGRGVMTEAVHRIVAHAFAPAENGGLGLRRLVLRSAAGNAASQHVAEANGFSRTGVQRKAERLGDGSYDDLVDHDLLAEEWLAR
jgi:RimJ/RimL family protein N-acetyltransferase